MCVYPFKTILVASGCNVKVIDVFFTTDYPQESVKSDPSDGHKNQHDDSELEGRLIQSMEEVNICM